MLLGALLAWLTGLTHSARFAWFRARPIYVLGAPRPSLRLANAERLVRQLTPLLLLQSS